MTKTFQIGDRVEAGAGEDHDTGIVHEIKDDDAYVGWESGVSTWTPLADLQPAD